MVRSQEAEMEMGPPPGRWAPPVPLSVLTDSTKPRMSTPPLEAAISISPAEHRALAEILEPFWVTMALGDSELDVMVTLPAAPPEHDPPSWSTEISAPDVPAPARSTGPPAVMVIVAPLLTPAAASPVIRPPASMVSPPEILSVSALPGLVFSAPLGPRM
jgi:hypothetical protein